MVEFKTQKIFHVILKEGVGGWGEERSWYTGIV